MKVEPAWVEVKLKLAEVLFVRLAGAELMVVSGARLIVHVRMAGVGSVTPCLAAAT